MQDCLLIQRAFFAVLEDAVMVAGRADPVPVFDEDDQIAPPYIVIGETTEAPDDTHDGFGTSETCTLHFWSRTKGKRVAGVTRWAGSTECKAMMGAADALLHQQTLTLDDARQVHVTREFAEVLREEVETGETWRHGVARYRVRTLESADDGGY